MPQFEAMTIRASDSPLRRYLTSMRWVGEKLAFINDKQELLLSGPETTGRGAGRVTVRMGAPLRGILCT